MAEKSTKQRTSKKRRDDEIAVEVVQQPEPMDDAAPVLTVDDLVGPAPQPAEPPGAQAAAEPVADLAGDEPVSPELKAIVEALVFASPEPLTPKALCKLMASEPAEDVMRAIGALKADYQQVRGLHLVEIAGGLQIVTRPDLNEWVRRLFHERKSSRLSVQALETLAVIAYRQPVTSVEIAEIRGVNTSGVLSTLVERKLIKTAGRKAVVGRPFLYATTKEFLLRFGLNDISDLPRVEDLADALGFELPALLNEPLPTDQFLPLGEPEPTAETAETDLEPDIASTDDAERLTEVTVAEGPEAGMPADETPADETDEPAVLDAEEPEAEIQPVELPEAEEPDVEDPPAV